jgi:hypothetical protein
MTSENILDNPDTHLYVIDANVSLVVEELRTGRKELVFTTMYKRKRETAVCFRQPPQRP